MSCLTSMYFVTSMSCVTFQCLMWLFSVSCDFLLSWMTFHCLVWLLWLFIVLCDFSLSFVTLQCRVWLFSVSCDFSVSFVTFHCLVWLFSVLCHFSLSCVTFHCLVSLFSVLCDFWLSCETFDCLVRLFSVECEFQCLMWLFSFLCDFSVSCVTFHGLVWHFIVFCDFWVSCETFHGLVWLFSVLCDFSLSCESFQCSPSIILHNLGLDYCRDFWRHFHCGFRKWFGHLQLQYPHPTFPRYREDRHTDVRDSHGGKHCGGFLLASGKCHRFVTKRPSHPLGPVRTKPYFVFGAWIGRPSADWPFVWEWRASEGGRRNLWCLSGLAESLSHWYRFPARGSTYNWHICQSIL